MSEPIQLRKCPFCSVAPRGEKTIAGRWLYWYVCPSTSCGVGNRLGEYSLEQAAKVWNNQTEVVRLELDIVQEKAKVRALELQNKDLFDKLQNTQFKLMDCQQKLMEAKCTSTNSNVS